MKRVIFITGEKKRACLAASAVAILWGLSFIGSGKALSGGMQTFSLVAVRFLVAALALYPISRAKSVSLALRIRDLLPMTVTALTGVTVYYAFELRGLVCTSASVASLIIATIPVFSLIAGVLLFGKRPPARTWAGVGLSLLGVYLLAFTDVGENTAEGCLCLFGACVCWVAYLEVTDRLLKRYSDLAVTFWQSVLGFLTSAPIAAFEDVRWADITLDAWLWACVFLGLICSALCFILNNYSVSVLSPQINAVFLNLSPAATVAGELILFGHSVTPMQLVGGTVILLSLYMIAAAERRSAKPTGTAPSDK